MFHPLTIPVKWGRMEPEGKTSSSGFLIFSPTEEDVQEAAFLCCRSGRETGVKFLELFRDYNDEDICRDYLEELRWPNGVACPRCGNLEVSQITTRNTYDCLECRYVFSLTSGTALHGTKIPLQKWMVAAFLMCTSKKGMSAIQLQEYIEVSYKSAWYLNHRIRNALQQSTDRLTNFIEVDETFIGGKTTGKGRGYKGNKAIVVGIIQREGERVLQVKDDRTKNTLHQFILGHIDPELSEVFTDDWLGYKGLPNHHTITHSKNEYVRDGQIHTNTVEGLWSLLKGSIVGTFHHVSIKHLPLYLNELAWRQSNRHQGLFELTLTRLLSAEHLRYEQLVGGN